MRIRCHVLRSLCKWMASLWPPTQHSGESLGKATTRVQMHFSLHFGCMLVMSHRYLRPGIETSFLLSLCPYQPLCSPFPEPSLWSTAQKTQPLWAFGGRWASSLFTPPTLGLYLSCALVFSPTWPAFHGTFSPPCSTSHWEREEGVHAKPLQLHLCISKSPD